ncbi:hypothetical protein ACQ4LE_003631 [Meloidogyne hapla]
MKIKNKKFPTELLFEIFHFISLNIKWDKIRVSKLFDIFILKLQRNWIVRLKFTKTKIVSTLKASEKSVNVMRGLDQNMSDSLVKYFNDELDDIYGSFRFYAKSNSDFANVIANVAWPSFAAHRVNFETKRGNVLSFIRKSIAAVKDDVECMDKLGDWLVFSNKLEAYISSMMQRYNARGQAVGI